MIQHTRMFKTLACLAASMICGALLLGWLEPSVADGTSSGSPVPDANLAQSMARRAIESAALPHVGWSAIEVVAFMDLPAGPAGALTATSFPEDFQFLVPPSGRLQSVPTRFA